MSELVIETIRPGYCAALARLQIACYPTLGAEELMDEGNFRRHCEIFPAGNFVALWSGRVVGLGAGLLVDFDFANPQHRFMEIIGGGDFAGHRPAGRGITAPISVCTRIFGSAASPGSYTPRARVTWRRRGSAASSVVA